MSAFHCGFSIDVVRERLVTIFGQSAVIAKKDTATYKQLVVLTAGGKMFVNLWPTTAKASIQGAGDGKEIEQMMLGASHRHEVQGVQNPKQSTLPSLPVIEIDQKRRKLNDTSSFFDHIAWDDI